MSETVWLKAHMEDLEKRYGGVRAAAKFLDMDPGYWSRLKNGKKQRPSKETLDKLGLELCSYYITK